MADIRRVKLPNGTTYNIKDNTARTNINNIINGTTKIPYLPANVKVRVPFTLDRSFGDKTSFTMDAGVYGYNNSGAFTIYGVTDNWQTFYDSNRAYIKVREPMQNAEIANFIFPYGQAIGSTVSVPAHGIAESASTAVWPTGYTFTSDSGITRISDPEVNTNLSYLVDSSSTLKVLKADNRSILLANSGNSATNYNGMQGDYAWAIFNTMNVEFETCYKAYSATDAAFITVELTAYNSSNRTVTAKAIARNATAYTWEKWNGSAWVVEANTQQITMSASTAYRVTVSNGTTSDRSEIIYIASMNYL